MNNEQTISKLNQMRIGAMAQLHAQHVKNNGMDTYTPDEYLGILTDHEWENRQNLKIQRLLKQAHFRQKASLEELRFDPSRNLDKGMFNRLATLDFIARNENLIITGASGVGKSYIAQALGHQACFNGLKTLYSNTTRLLKRLRLAKSDGTYLNELSKLRKVNLLILDDFGLQTMDNHGREAFMDIIDDRYMVTSTIIISQIPVSLWYDIIGESTIADAILDRIVNSSHRIDLKGESLRKGFIKD